MTAASLETFRTTAPEPSRADANSAPSSAFVKRNGPTRLVANARSRLSQSVSPSSARGVAPRSDALLIKMSSPPIAPKICRAIGWMSDFKETSPTIPWTPANSFATCSTRVRVRATNATRAHARTIRARRASPSPDVPPEIATRKPLNRLLESECEHSSIVGSPC